jgi:hypothetical protein
VSTLIPLQLKNRLWTTVVLFHCCTLIWGLTNNNYSLYLLQFMTVSVNIRSCYICIPWLSIYSWTVEQIGIDIFLLLKATFCVVLIQSIVIFKKKGGVHIKNDHQIICCMQWWHHKFLLQDDDEEEVDSDGDMEYTEEVIHWGCYWQYDFRIFKRLKENRGGSSRGRTRRPPSLKLEKIWFFFSVKSWFITRNTPNIFAPPSAIGKKEDFLV